VEPPLGHQHFSRLCVVAPKGLLNRQTLGKLFYFCGTENTNFTNLYGLDRSKACVLAPPARTALNVPRRYAGIALACQVMRANLNYSAGELARFAREFPN
jgi:hypothetical protein